MLDKYIDTLSPGLYRKSILYQSGKTGYVRPLSNASAWSISWARFLLPRRRIAPPRSGGGWRDWLLVIVGFNLICVIAEPQKRMLLAFEHEEHLLSLLWALSTVAIGSMAVTLIIIGCTHEARAGIRRFFRDRPNLTGWAYLLGLLTSIGLVAQMMVVALTVENSFHAMEYLGGMIFFAITGFYCFLGVVNWAYDLIDEADSSYILAAQQGNAHDW